MSKPEGFSCENKHMVDVQDEFRVTFHEILFIEVNDFMTYG
jgi:hypothetical protein